MKKQIFATMIVTAVAVHSSWAGLLDVVQGYNVFTSGDINVKWSDSEGKVAGGGNVTIEAYGIGSKSAPSKYSLVGGGNVTFTNGTVYNGGIYAGGNLTVKNADVRGAIGVEKNLSQSNGGKYQSFTVGGNVSVNSANRKLVTKGDPGNSPVDFASAKNTLDALSDDLASYNQNGTILNNYGQLRFSGKNETNIFNITADQLKSANGLYFDIGSNVAIINVSGSTASLANLGFFNATAENILFNFYEATAVGISSVGVQGSILATDAAITFNYGNVDGQVIGSVVKGTGEFHQKYFNTNAKLPPKKPPVNVPEPSIVGMMLTGLLSLGLIRKRTKK